MTPRHTTRERFEPRGVRFEGRLYTVRWGIYDHHRGVYCTYPNAVNLVLVSEFEARMRAAVMNADDDEHSDRS